MLRGWGAAAVGAAARGTVQAAGAGGAVLTHSLVSLSHKCHQLVVRVAAAGSQGYISHDSLGS